MQMLSERYFIYGSYQAALAHVINGHNPLYFYNFNYRGLQSYGDVFAVTKNNIDFNWGVSHCDELLYLFESPRFFRELQGSDREMRTIMVDVWTHFATYGLEMLISPQKWSNKNIFFRYPLPLEFIFEKKVVWTPLSIQEVQNQVNFGYMNFEGRYGGEISLKMKRGFNLERMQFWRNQGLLESVPYV